MDTIAQPHMSRREQKKLETHQRVIASSVALFIEKGYDGTTVDEISAAAGISKPTFFNYFPSKQSILTTLIDGTDREIIDNVKARCEATSPSSEQLRQLFASAASVIMANEAIAKILVTHGLQSYQGPETVPPIERMRTFVTTLLEKGRDQGEFDQEEVLDSQFYLTYGMYFHTIADWACNSELKLPERMATGAEFVIRKLVKDPTN